MSVIMLMVRNLEVVMIVSMNVVIIMVMFGVCCSIVKFVVRLLCSLIFLVGMCCTCICASVVVDIRNVEVSIVSMIGIDVNVSSGVSSSGLMKYVEWNVICNSLLALMSCFDGMIRGISALRVGANGVLISDSCVVWVVWVDRGDAGACCWFC